MEEEVLKYLQKKFKGKTIEYDGYKYEFLDVYIEDYHFTFVVNTILPVKGGAYLLEKIYENIGDIVGDFFYSIGERFTISVNVLIDGKDVKYSYVPWEDVEKIFELANVNANTDTFSISDKDFKHHFEIRVKFYPPIKTSNVVQFDDGVGLLVYVDIIQIKMDGEEVIPNLDTERNVGVFREIIEEFNDLGNKVENIMYDVLEPQLQFGSNESFYYNAYTRFKNYKGIPLETKSGYVGDKEIFVKLFNSL